MTDMRLDGIHHISAITGDAQANLDFYVSVLGLRFVKKTVNFDAPDTYHLYYGDRVGSPGSALTFFDFGGMPAGVAGAGSVHTIAFRVGNADALQFWSDRFRAVGMASEIVEDRLQVADPDGLTLAFEIDESEDEPLVWTDGPIPLEYALRGFAGVKAYSKGAELEETFLKDALGFEPAGPCFVASGSSRSSYFHLESDPGVRTRQGAGSVHHVAWTVADEQQTLWRSRILEFGVNPTPVIDRKYFHSVYFFEPNGILFELATETPGFTVDEDIGQLGEGLQLPPGVEQYRNQIERALPPLTQPSI